MLNITKDCYSIFLKYYRDRFEEVEKGLVEVKEKCEVLTKLKKKFAHSMWVVDNVEWICENENIPLDIRKMCEVAALFHDIGRFDQTIKFNSFDDSNTLDHAELSGQILLSFKGQLLHHAEEYELEIIYKAICTHNKKEVSFASGSTIKVVSNVLSDANKLQILDVNFKNNMFQTKDSRYSGDGVIKQECIDEFKRRRVLDNSIVDTVLENRIKCASWIFDMKYASSKRKMIDEGYMDILLSTDKISNKDVVSAIKKIQAEVEEYIKLHLIG